MNVLVIDNYDSFTYNLVQMIGELGLPMVVKRNDRVTLHEAVNIKPSHIVISPGPGTPAEAGISKEFIEYFGPAVPILGVCLGHQCIVEVYGGEVIKASKPVHGKVSRIYHSQESIFQGLTNPFTATRYHSLIASRGGLPSELGVLAETEDGEIMAVKHRKYPVWGVQFHPESILTREGKRLISNFFYH